MMSDGGIDFGSSYPQPQDFLVPGISSNRIWKFVFLIIAALLGLFLYLAWQITTKDEETQTVILSVPRDCSIRFEGKLLSPSPLLNKSAGKNATYMASFPVGSNSIEIEQGDGAKKVFTFRLEKKAEPVFFRYADHALIKD